MFSAAYEFDLVAENTFTGNVAAGGPIGVKLGGVMPDTWHGNVIHSAQIGIGINGNCSSAKPIRLQDTTIYRAWDFAVWGHTDRGCSLFEFDRMRLVDSKVSFVWGAAGDSAVTHIIGDQKIFLTNSLIVGQSYGNSGNCDTSGSTTLAFSWHTKRAQAGIMLPIFVSAYLTWPEWGTYGEAYSEITYANFMANSYPQLFGEVHVVNSTVLRFGLPGCIRSHVFENIPAASDANYPEFFSGMTTDESSRANVSLFSHPFREWITIDDCVAVRARPRLTHASTAPGRCQVEMLRSPKGGPCVVRHAVQFSSTHRVRSSPPPPLADGLRRSQARLDPRSRWHTLSRGPKRHTHEHG